MYVLVAWFAAFFPFSGNDKYDVNLIIQFSPKKGSFILVNLHVYVCLLLSIIYFSVLIRNTSALEKISN